MKMLRLTLPFLVLVFAGTLLTGCEPLFDAVGDARHDCGEEFATKYEDETPNTHACEAGAYIARDILLNEAAAIRNGVLPGYVVDRAGGDRVRIDFNRFTDFFKDEVRKQCATAPWAMKSMLKRMGPIRRQIEQRACELGSLYLLHAVESRNGKCEQVGFERTCWLSVR
jgi:hypothetical protein